MYSPNSSSAGYFFTFYGFLFSPSGALNKLTRPNPQRESYCKQFIVKQSNNNNHL